MSATAPSSADQHARTMHLLDATPAWHRLCELRELGPELADAILDAAVKLADEVLAPINRTADLQGCSRQGDRVGVPEVFHAAFARIVEGGWIGLDLPERHGGSGLPLVLQAASAQILDRGCVALTMCVGGSRAGAVLLHEHAPAQVAQEWIPEVISGKRTLTICVSEAQAGSDLGRIRTRAAAVGDRWLVTGDKLWTSFGGHNLAPVIGHCVLARTSDAAGTRGLSLFLVPNVREDGSPNGVTTVGIESKLGLHASPTCSLHFEEAEGILLGRPERGLPQMFTMIELMRLQTGCQGLGLATASIDLAETYAKERLQGGDPEAPPVPIIQHPDVQRQLGVMRGRTEILRAAVLELGSNLDIARMASGAEAERARKYTAFMLPLVKNFGAEIGFDVASGAMQVLGGAGYTTDWPLELYLRDARILSIYEGTTGMQAWDFLDRRLIRDRASFDSFLASAAALSDSAERVVQRFAKLGETLIATGDEERLRWAADDWLRAGWIAFTAILSPRIALSDEAAALYATAQIEERFAVHEAAVLGALGL